MVLLLILTLQESLQQVVQVVGVLHLEALQEQQEILLLLVRLKVILEEMEQVHLMLVEVAEELAQQELMERGEVLLLVQHKQDQEEMVWHLQ